MKAFQIACSVVSGLVVAGFGVVGAFVVPKYRELFDEILEGSPPTIISLYLSVSSLGYLAGSLVLAALAAAVVAVVKPPWAAGIAAFGIILLVTLGYAVLVIALFLPLTQTIQAMN